MVLLGGLLELKRKLSEIRKIKLCVKLCQVMRQMRNWRIWQAACATCAIDKQPAQFDTFDNQLDNQPWQQIPDVVVTVKS